MRDYFFALTERLIAGLSDREHLLLALSGEDSDFVRLNRGRVRQAGHVRQAALHLDLIDGARHATLDYQLRFDRDADFAVLRDETQRLRQLIPRLPDDPHLLYATAVNDSEHRDDHALPGAPGMVHDLVTAAFGLDLVGLLASGPVYHGFANSLGQRNWHESRSFNLDWSCYLQGDKGVKAHYAGTRWSSDALDQRMQRVRRDLEVMARPPVRLAPGDYRSYLAPAALGEILALLSWEGFGLKAHRSAQTPLLRMAREGVCLNRVIDLSDHAAAGLGPRFTDSGFVKPDRVRLIADGAYRDCLVGPRSGREFDAAVTGGEIPEALDLAAGGLPMDQVPAALERGLLVNNLWYCNFSDTYACRITGMTRFACFWVEGGEIRAPIDVMRFDDSLYRLLGDALIDLTRERELLLDTDTYGGRSSASQYLPGALLSAMRFTF